MIKREILVIVLLLAFKTMFSQEVNLFVKDIKEERHLEQEDSFVELKTIIKGLKIDEFNQVKVKNISKAIDDSGNKLKKKESFFGDDYNNSNEITLKLEAPFRKSTKITLLEGTIKHFSPSESNGSKIIINNPLKKYNKNLLKKNKLGVKLILVDKKTLEKLKKEDEKKYNEELKKLKKEGGLGEGLAETINIFKDFFESFSNFGSSEKSLSFYIDDKEDKIVEILIYNEKGKKMNYGSSKMGSHNLTINLKDKVTENWKIEVLVENEKSLKEYKFTLTNIILP